MLLTNHYTINQYEPINDCARFTRSQPANFQISKTQENDSDAYKKKLATQDEQFRID